MITILAVSLLASAVLGCVSRAEVAVHRFAPPRPRLVLDLARLQEGWARLRGRGAGRWRQEMAYTAHHLAETRALADAVLAGETSVEAALASIMDRRYPSVRLRHAYVQQFRAYVYADVARSWSDPEWPTRWTGCVPPAPPPEHHGHRNAVRELCLELMRTLRALAWLLRSPASK